MQTEEYQRPIHDLTAKSNGGFNEGIVSKKVDPLHGPAWADFDFDEVSRALGEPEFEREDVTSLASRALNRILDFCLNIDINKENAQLLVGRRLIALAWVINPGLFEDSPSARELSKRLGFKSEFPMVILTGEASRFFNLRNRAQAHAWNHGNTSITPLARSEVLNTQGADAAIKDAPTGKQAPRQALKNKKKESFFRERS